MVDAAINDIVEKLERDAQLVRRGLVRQQSSDILSLHGFTEGSLPKYMSAAAPDADEAADCSGYA